ncbi:MAG: hypothetical protein HOP08_07635 [Cyclobacteriaceae bacterium]|nr:hypothetical protein [Cyclobacteriaceae bacterium]
MKIFVIIVCVVTATLLAFGALFKMLHLRGATVVSLSGIFFLVIVLIPSSIIYFYRKTDSVKTRI